MREHLLVHIGLLCCVAQALATGHCSCLTPLRTLPCCFMRDVAMTVCPHAVAYLWLLHICGHANV